MRKSPKAKLTKSAKKLVVHVEKYTVELRETKYYCDLCGTTYHGYDSTSIQKDVTRFKCQCGQEYIVEFKDKV